MLIRDRMKRDPITVTADDTLAHALELTRRYRIRHLPVVVEGHSLVGIISDRDIRLAMPSPLTAIDEERAEAFKRTPVAAIMVRNVVTVRGVDTVEDAAKLMTRHRIGSLPVVNADGELEGVVTETDLLHVFVEILGGVKGASRFEVAIPDEPGELARVIAVIGQEMRLNIVSLVVPSWTASDHQKVAIIHLDTIDPREALAALEQRGWRVGWPSLQWDLRTVPAEQ